MEEHESRSASAHNLATEIAKEIPERDRQEEFLRRWEQMSQSRRMWINHQRTEDETPEEIAEEEEYQDENTLLPAQSSASGEMLDRIGNDFAHYIGPIAKTLMKHYTAITSDTDQLVKYLGQEIPDRKKGQKFVKSWLRNR